jgi:flagellar hook-associated protein 2
LNRSKTALTAQVSAFGVFNSALATFQATLATLQDSTKLAGRTATLGDTTIATATATSSAVAGQYSIQVQNLASAASLSSQPVLSGTTAIGTGTLTLAVGGVSSSITIDSTNNTLQGIVSTINSAPNNPGVTASIITTTAGARLVLSGTATGAANTIKVTQSGGDGGLAALQYDPANGLNNLTQTQAALNANFSVNGYAATSASNQVGGVIGGVTLNLAKATAANTPTTLTIGSDTQGAQTSISTFVTALNGLQTSIRSLTGYNASTKTAGPLLGNQTLMSFQNQLSKILGQVNSSISSGPNSLAALGIAANPQGTFSSNATTLGKTALRPERHCHATQYLYHPVHPIGRAAGHDQHRPAIELEQYLEATGRFDRQDGGLFGDAHGRIQRDGHRSGAIEADADLSLAGIQHQCRFELYQHVNQHRVG